MVSGNRWDGVRVKELLLSAWRHALALGRCSLWGAESEQAGHRPFLRQLTVSLERDDLDGGWVAECLELPGCVAQGETLDEAISNIIDAIAAVITVRMEQQINLEPMTDTDNRRRLALTV
jgi:predicted RNase H-like HicB family nuclease